MITSGRAWKFSPFNSFESSKTSALIIPTPMEIFLNDYDVVEN